MPDKATTSTPWQVPTILGYLEPGSTPILPVFEQESIQLLSQLPKSSQQSEGPWLLQQSAMRLSLIRPDGVALCIDMTSGKARHRSQEAGHGAQHLAKALGLANYRKRTGELPTITDATAGLGQDAWVMASLGCQVSLIERHPIIHALLDNALTRALADPDSREIAARIRLSRGNATKHLEETASAVIYLDPMYPQRQRKKASSKKGMQFLHALLGPVQATASKDLLRVALACNPDRVVVKRPKGADLLEGTDHFSGQLTTIESPNTRYDIYHGEQR